MASAAAQPKRAWLGNLLLLALSGAFVLAAAEIATRLLERAAAAKDLAGESWAIYDPDLGYRPRPGYDGWNELGLRDEPLAKPKQRFRVLLLGDSVPFYGDTSADTFPGHLERALQANPALAPSEVVNAGVRGYTNYQETLFLEKYGVSAEPDLVGVAFVLNDLHEILHQFQLVNGEIVGQSYAFSSEAQQQVQSPVYRLLARSHFLVWLRRKLAVFDDLIELYAGDRFSFELRPDFGTAWQEAPWRDVEAQLARARDLGAQRGFRLFVVVFPFADQLRSDYLARDADFVRFPQRKLAELCGRLGVPLLDLFDELDAAQDFDPDRIHLTAAGRRRAGERIARFLADERLVPAAPSAIAPSAPQ
jgi:lysophospholipase L1-like esterase